MTFAAGARSRTDDDSALMGWIDDLVTLTEYDPFRYLAPTYGWSPGAV